MFTEPRRRLGNRARLTQEFDWVSRQSYLAHLRMIVLYDHLPLCHWRLGKRAVQIVDRGSGHLGSAQELEPILHCAGAKDFLKSRHKCGPVFDPSCIRRKSRIIGQIWDLQHLAKFPPKTFLPGTNDDITILNFEGLPWHRVIMGRARRLRKGFASSTPTNIY